jgi:hypothetical protein
MIGPGWVACRYRRAVQLPVAPGLGPAKSWERRVGPDASVPPRAGGVRYRYLAVKARREANAVSGDPIAPRLIELAEKLEGDAVRDEEEARILLAEQDEATPLRQHDRDAGVSGRSCERPRQAAGGEQP